MFFRSSSTESSHLNLRFPTRRVLSGLSTVSFLQGSSYCILKSCPSHLTLPIVTFTTSSSPYSCVNLIIVSCCAAETCELIFIYSILSSPQKRLVFTFDIFDPKGLMPAAAMHMSSSFSSFPLRLHVMFLFTAAVG